MSSIASASSAAAVRPQQAVQAPRPKDADGDHDGTKASAAPKIGAQPLATSGSVGRTLNVKA